MHLSTAWHTAVMGLQVMVLELERPRSAAGDILDGRDGGSGGRLVEVGWGGGGQVGALSVGGDGGQGGSSGSGAEDIVHRYVPVSHKTSK